MEKYFETAIHFPSFTKPPKLPIDEYAQPLEKIEKNIKN